MPLPFNRRHEQKSDGVTVYLLARLGNQLFIYAAGLAQARRLGVPLYVNLAYYTLEKPRRDYPTPYMLDHFDSDVRIPEGNAFHRRLFLRMPTQRAAHTWHTQISTRMPLMANVYMEPAFEYDPGVNKVMPGTTMLGHFQSWKYFVDVADEVRERMTETYEHSAWFEQMAAELAPGRGSIVLNVRRGDYLDPKQMQLQGIARRAYYERSLALLRRLGYDGQVYVASDSLELVLEELSGIADLAPIDHPEGGDPFELMLLLARADGLVLANSSFGWWAGYLGERQGRTVIAPRPWMERSNIDTRDLLLPAWLTLDRAE